MELLDGMHALNTADNLFEEMSVEIYVTILQYSEGVDEAKQAAVGEIFNCIVVYLHCFTFVGISLVLIRCQYLLYVGVFSLVNLWRQTQH